MCLENLLMLALKGELLGLDFNWLGKQFQTMLAQWVKESCKALDLEHTRSNLKLSLTLYEVSCFVNKLLMSSGAKL